MSIPTNPGRIEETAAWIRFGDRHLQSAATLMKRAQPLIGNGLFHCQQAVEKWMKAFLIWNGIAFPKIHDLGRLGALCLEVDPGLRDVVESVADLTDFATIYRYPGPEPELDDADALAWMVLTEQARVPILAKIPGDVLDVS